MRKPKAVLAFMAMAQRNRARAARAAVDAQGSQLRHVVKMLLLLTAPHFSRRLSRRRIVRSAGGWETSTMHGYVYGGDDQQYRKKFRVSPTTMHYITDVLKEEKILCDGAARDPSRRIPALFKVATCMYYLAQGGGFFPAADCASVGESTVRSWLDMFVDGVLTVLKDRFMPSEPDTPENLERIRQNFAGRRGIGNCVMAVDGTHVPYTPLYKRTSEDYKNYKGFHSILALAFVNSFYLFVDADVGFPGRAADNTVLARSSLMESIKEDPEKWLGEGGCIAADGGASDLGKFFLNPVPNATHPHDLYYNFCHSSTRFFVEEVFGRWKSRFRFLLKGEALDHARMTKLIFASMVLHNVCTVRQDDTDTYDMGGDAEQEWTNFYEKYRRKVCPDCARLQILDCVHVEKNRRATKFKGWQDAAVLRTQVKQDLWRKMEGLGVAAVNQIVARLRVRHAQMK